MIRIQLCGGLGNQMFQFAAGYGLSRHSKLPLFLDMSWFQVAEDLKKITNHPLTITYADLSNIEFFIRKKLVARTLARRNFLGERWLSRIKGFSVFIEEDPFKFDPRIKQIQGRTLMFGYYQSPKYFSDFRDELCQRLRVFTHEDANINRFRSEIAQSRSVGVHVRRGDYISNPDANRVHGVTGKDFYQKAIDLLLQNQSGLKFFVFSDDLPWARAQKIWPKNVVFVEDNQYHPSIGMNLLAECEHHILANSTFGWWGGWLKERDGRVIVPKMWLRNRDIEKTDLLVEGWEVL